MRLACCLHALIVSIERLKHKLQYLIDVVINEKISCISCNEGVMTLLQKTQVAATGHLHTRHFPVRPVLFLANGRRESITPITNTVVGGGTKTWAGGHFVQAQHCEYRNTSHGEQVHTAGPLTHQHSEDDWMLSWFLIWVLARSYRKREKKDKIYSYALSPFQTNSLSHIFNLFQETE